MFCNKCGAQINNNDLFCPKCGNRISSQNVSMPYTCQYNNQFYQSQMYSNNNYITERSKKGIDEIVIFIILIALNLVLFFTPMINIYQQGKSLYSIRTIGEVIPGLYYSKPKLLSPDAQYFGVVLGVLSIVILWMVILAIFKVKGDPTTNLLIASSVSMVQLLGAIVYLALVEKSLETTYSFSDYYDLLIGLSSLLIVIEIAMKVINKKYKQ